MKTLIPRLSALLAALLLNAGLVRAADFFDPLPNVVSVSPENGSSCSSPPCVEPPMIRKAQS